MPKNRRNWDEDVPIEGLEPADSQPAPAPSGGGGSGKWWKNSPDELSQQGLETCDETKHPGRDSNGRPGPDYDCYWCNFDTRGWERGWCPQAGGGKQQQGGQAPQQSVFSPGPTQQAINQPLPNTPIKPNAAVPAPSYGQSGGLSMPGSSLSGSMGGLSLPNEKKRRGAMGGLSTQSGNYVPGIGGGSF
jgi:hypothetical protein